VYVPHGLIAARPIGKLAQLKPGRCLFIAWLSSSLTGRDITDHWPWRMVCDMFAWYSSTLLYTSTTLTSAGWNPNAVAKFVTKMVEDVMNIHEKEARQIRVVHTWKTPPHDFLKLNVDGAFNEILSRGGT
jgi:hypothetical protein